MTAGRVLVTGASGYIAGRLVPPLLEGGWRVRCLVRDPAWLEGLHWAGSVEVARGDLLQPQGLAAALQGVRAAYYLVHSMANGRRYPQLDLQAASNFARAAQAAGLEQIIYLGGLADPRRPLSPHMRSRFETGQALRSGSVPVTEFRAGVIIGPGSISFEMIRYISEQFPLLPGPSWLGNRSQPIAVADVLAYLLAALETPASRGRVIEIGGADVMTHAESLLAYARRRGLRRRILLLPPVLPVDWIARLVGRLTPVPAAIARPLLGGLAAPSVVHSRAARRLFPLLRPAGYQAALTAALAGLHPARVELRLDPRRPVQSLKQEGFLLDVRRARAGARPEAVFAVLAGMGGKDGWPFANLLWRLRGWVDRAAGGPGLRGRPQVLAEGAELDFYRVETLRPGRSLLLRGEMKAPGQGWMEWRLGPDGAGTRLTQIAWFAPRGVPGFLYWHLLGPLHRFVFAGLLRRIAAPSRRPPGGGVLS